MYPWSLFSQEVEDGVVVVVSVLIIVLHYILVLNYIYISAVFLNLIHLS